MYDHLQDKEPAQWDACRFAITHFGTLMHSIRSKLGIGKSDTRQLEPRLGPPVITSVR